MEAKMLNAVMLHTKLEEWKNNWTIFHIYTDIYTDAYR